MCLDIDFVNGCIAEVESFDSRSSGVRLVTRSGTRFATYCWTDREMGYRVYHPLRLGSASTVIKFRGTELEHVTIYLDTGAAYTALSCEKSAEDYLIGGIVKANHFYPAHMGWQRKRAQGVLI